ncbi:hypothetical protein MFERI15181_00814 [Mycoplasma feriruminatoris]|uniref:DUF3800 domain-containing protein n=1 Tax=Mycoplasma feriruminatoris TaxID=1179777 RepID=A0ABY8HYA4_9MOLU|nr:DUF3800 domain-containing protein [Mycoplasma feriruminatoris]WFQ93893.1 hypothetical protein MFERI15181_00814 [Mycoplasma feriruminatoris]
MKKNITKYIKLYLDETGSSASISFIVGGFYLYGYNQKDILIREEKIGKNILSIKSIIKSNKHIKNEIDKEIKYRDLNFKNKLFLFNNIKNNGQINVSMISDLEKIRSTNKQIIIEYIYNISVFLIIKKILFHLLEIKYLKITDLISIEVNIDQRRKHINWTAKSNSFKELNIYLNTRMYENSQFLNIQKINVYQYDSKLESTIRYADYYVGLLGSVDRVHNNRSKTYDLNSENLLKLFNSHIKHLKFSNDLDL